MPNQFTGTTFRDRFNTKVNKDTPTGCWLWVGATVNGGYGCIYGPDQKNQRAHRVSWEFHRGPIPNNLCVLHKCDVRLCVNPEHLFLGTRADNNSDMHAKNRASTGENRPLAKLTADDVRAIRAIPRIDSTSAKYEHGLQPRDSKGHFLPSGEKTDKSLAREYGVTSGVINHIRNGKSWRHI